MNVQTDTDARVAVVVPSLDYAVDRLRRSLHQQTFQDYQLIVVSGVSPGGLARNEGVALATADYIVFIDDDAFLGHPRVLELMIAVLDNDPTVGVVGSSKLTPPDATWFQRRVADEVPRWVFPILTTDTESNPPLDRYGFTGITTTCCVVRRAILEEVGGFDPTLVKGQDTDLFYRIRRAGYRFVIPAYCWVFHDPPDTLWTLMMKSFWSGVSHAIEARRYPERHMNIVPLDQWYGRLLVLVYPLLILPSIFVTILFEPERRLSVGFRPIKALSTALTLYGYVYGWYEWGRIERARGHANG